MSELILEWTENRQQRHTKITNNQPTKHPGTYRIGRHPAHCDLVISHPTVSGLHVEIFYDSVREQFGLRNLRESNPPTINGRPLPQGEVWLKMGSIVSLGKVVFTVTSIKSVDPATVVASQSPAASSPSPQLKISSTQGVYMLRCPSCGRDCPREWMENRVGCRWCGCSLDAGMSVFVPRQK